MTGGFVTGGFVVFLAQCACYKRRSLLVALLPVTNKKDILPPPIDPKKEPITVAVLTGKLDGLFNNVKELVDSTARRTENVLRKEIERLDVKIDGVEKRLDGKIDGVRTELKEDIRQTEKRLDAKIDGVEKNLSDKIDKIGGRLDDHEDRIIILEKKQTNHS